MKHAIIAHYDSYNARRYSKPWVCTMTDDCKYNFAVEVGTYTGDHRQGGDGDLVVFSPLSDCVYAYGQKDRRGNNTQIRYAIWDGAQFVPCDKLGRTELCNANI